MKNNKITTEAQDTNNINDCYHNNTPTIYDGTAHEPATLPETGTFTDRSYTAPDGTTTTYKAYEGPVYPAKYLGANYRDSNKDSLLLTFELLNTRYDRRIYNKYQTLKPDQDGTNPTLRSPITTLSTYLTEDTQAISELAIIPTTLISILKRLKNQIVYVGFTANGTYTNIHIIKKQNALNAMLQTKIQNNEYDI